MVQTQILPIVQHYLRDRGIPISSTPNQFPTYRVPNAPWDVLMRVNDTLSVAIHRSRTSGRGSSTFCPLDPELDSFRDLELSVSVHLPASVKRSPRSTIANWFTCELCGKVFATRYYLDLHQSNHHHDHSESSTTNGNNNVCLGTTVCQALGGCHEQALLLEPYYARGSGGTGPDAAAVKAAYARQLPTCTSESMAQSRDLCVAMMADCFPHDLAIQLQHAVCDHAISCQSKVSGYRHWYLWRDEWEEHYENQKLGWVGVVLLVGLGIYYLSTVVDRWLGTASTSGGGRNRNSEGRRLLQKNSRGTRSSWSSTLYNWKAGKIKPH
jgi:hypothetical protein